MPKQVHVSKADARMSRMTRALVLLIIFIGLTARLPGVYAQQAPSSRRPEAAERSTGSEAPLDQIIHLPIVRKHYPLSSIFGVGMTVNDAGGLAQIQATDNQWVRGGGIAWSEVEPNEGDRNWGVLSAREQEFINARQSGFNMIVIVGSTPAWAQKVSGHTCGAIKEEKLDAFGDFLFDLVSRYSQAPYEINYWEIWNEPDIDPSLVPPDSAFGCWGDQTDTYYGGGYYGEMLKRVYPRIKAADPNAKVILGGLLLDCDPTNPPEGKDCSPSRFLEGILLAGAGSSFDAVSFHAYDYYLNEEGKYFNPNWYASWDVTGPASIQKAAFVKDVLEAYGAIGKWLFNTEAAVLCEERWGHDCGDTFQRTKAYFLIHSYVVALQEDLKVNSWYTVLGWRESELLDSGLNPLPAYYAFQFASRTLKGAIFERSLDEYSGLFGYAFQRTAGGDVWVLWSKDGGQHLISLPGTPDGVCEIDSTGACASLTPSTSLSVGLAPVFLEW
jgi:hypothetical protein